MDLGSRTLPDAFLESVVQPNVDEFREQFTELRRAFNAIASVDAFAANVYVWAQSIDHPEVTAVHSDDVFRQKLAAKNVAFSLLRDIAKAQKHVHLTHGNPSVTRASQVKSRAIGWGEGGFGGGRFGGVEQIVVDVTPTNFQYVESVVEDALFFLKEEYLKLQSSL